ncbi:hypothetical protein HID58_085069 [Brassica napus]|uniref:Uncharacterized protein n=1 Tax=Brassica napus TaxID=3708 RepID=A0ABQ7XLK2_BRANA|nr:hypothetical protein HID58_085069 [Brassica napus]
MLADGTACTDFRVYFTELQESVLREFGKEEKLWEPVLSYWTPTSFELATGIRTPHVQLTSDGAIKYFVQHMKVKGAMNLFVRFERNMTFSEKDNVDDSGMGFVTPVAFGPKSSSKLGSGTSNGGYISTGASKSNIIDLQDVEFLSEVERVEEVIKGGSEGGKGEALSQSSVGEEETVVEEVDELDVRPRGYDEDFWSPLLKTDYKGSNAVNVIYNEEEIVAGLTKSSGPRRYTCTTNDAFDHVVEVGGSSSGNMVLMPPLTTRPAGRRRKNMIPSTGEFPVAKKTKLMWTMARTMLDV